MDEQSQAGGGSDRALLHFHACHGRTSAGEAYRATLARPGAGERQVHVLVLDGRFDASSRAFARFQAEILALSMTRFPTLQSILEVVKVEGRIAVLSEAFDARDLGSLLTDGLPLRALLDAIGEVAAALDVAWNTIGPDGAQLKLVHQDIRPATLLVGQHGDVRLAHFGLGRALSADAPGGEHSHWLYMAPERFSRGDDRPAGDVYSLGNILYEGLVGRHPFHGKTFTELYPYMRDPALAEDWLADQLAQLPYDVPAAVESLVTRMLAVDPQKRLSAREVSRECDLLGDQVSGFPLKRWARERRWPAEISVPGPLVGRSVPALPLREHGPTPSIAPPAMLTPVEAAYDPLDAPEPTASRIPLSGPRTGTPAPVSAREPMPFRSATPAPAPLPVPAPSRPAVAPPPRQMPAPAPEPFPSIPPVAMVTQPRPVTQPDIARSVQPLETQLTSSWQRTLTPAPSRQRVSSPGSRGEAEPAIDFNAAPTAAPAMPRQLVEVGPSPLQNLLLALAGFSVVMALGIAAGAFLLSMNGGAPGPAPAPSLGDVIQPDGTRVSAVPEPVNPEPQPEPEPEPEVLPEPQPVADPEPALPRDPIAPVPQPVEPGGNAKQLARRGWDLVESRPGEAEQLFRSALEKKPGFDDANYGLGYALLKQNQASTAQSYLCDAQRSSDIEIQREVSALLKRNGLSCP